ncbi:hypothetical protein Q0Z83_022790 [Actinoplanes sichuanensis]|uniref:Subtilisin inhibitor-like n=1 Tax=Actinoplanes sichuanensis TaxID=512349 RepID=A0ABW4AJN2_9ACTN|nr:hypothetical protein [Actinoplanes sichuanensis]BEL04088.1 hypothetical protein Q0Z83_022790 [Actinoplanes sichuanensis]
MNRLAGTVTALAVAGTAVLAPATSAAAAHPAAAGACTPTRPGTGFYAGGRVASAPVTVPKSGCTTIAVSHIRDIRHPDDHCQTFLLALLPADGGDPTYTEPVQACSTPPGHRTVLATGVPDGTVFRVLYQVDYIEPEIQTVRFTVWR